MTKIVLGDKYENKRTKTIALTNNTREETNCCYVIVKTIDSSHMQAYKIFGKAASHELFLNQILGHASIKFGNHWMRTS